MITANRIDSIWVNPFSVSVPLEVRISFLLRFGIMGCFVCHGFWGLVSKAGWYELIGVFFISENASHFILPIVGTLDILVGVVAFFRPTRALLLWASFWTLFTAFLRPSAGLGMSEFFERAGNYGIPLAFLFLYAFPKDRSRWFSPIHINHPLSDKALKRLEWFMRVSLFLLLAGHGGIAFFKESPLLTKHFAGIGLNVSGSNLQLFGIFEMLLGVLVLLKPRLPGLLIFILIYKLSCELLFPITGTPRDIFETLERMGDYVIPLILWNIYRSQDATR